MSDLPKPAAVPCPSCPYRKDVPSGVWEADEYEKLPRYDKPTYAQPPQLFMCHQQNGCICSGWLACHDKGELLALRLHPVDPTAYEYRSPVPVFADGWRAALHGVKDIANPGPAARALMKKIGRRIARVREKEDPK